MSKDPWNGSSLQPMSYNPYLYAFNNSIRYSDPSGQCYGEFDFLRNYERQNCENLDMAFFILASSQATNADKRLAGAYVGAWGISHAYLGAGILALTAAGGAAVGGGYSAYQYEMAASGKCGCEVKQWALSMGKEKFIRQGMYQGAAGGGIFAGIGGLGSWGQIASGAGGAVLSGHGMYTSIRDMLNQGVNPCNAMNLGLSTVGMGLSGYQLRRGFSTRVNNLRRTALNRQSEISEPSGEFYSVEFEMTLDPGDIGTSHGVHTTRAMASLKASMQSDPAFAAAIESMIPGATEAIAAGRNPPGWVWHHAAETGTIQLVPAWQHTTGTQFWYTMHPEGRGGWSIWAIPAGAKPR